MSELHIQVVSDVVCPWCFVGEANLRRALDLLAGQRPEVRATLRWLPFLLNPDTPPAGEPYQPFLLRKFGSEAAVQDLQDRVAAAGRASGVEFAFGRIAVRPNTLNAHRLIRRAQARGDATALVQALFAAYFQRGENLADDAVLASVAAQCGDDDAATRAYLAGEADRDEVERQVHRLARAGVSGVPFFIFGAGRGLAGAHAPETLLAAMTQAIGEPPADI